MSKTKSPFIVFKYRDYTLAWTGFFISEIGMQMLLVGVNWQIYLMTKSPLSLGIIGAARFVPMLSLALLAGLAADIVNRKKLIFGVQLILMFVSFSLTVSTFNHTVSPLLIYGLIALNAAALSFSGPARQSLLPHLVPREHFMQAVGLNSLMWQTAMIIGPSLAGFIIGAWGIGYVYLISIFTVLAVNIAILFMKPHKNENKGTEFSFRSIRSGLGFVKRTPLIWSTMFLDFFATFFASSTALMPIFAKDILKVGPFGLGLLYAAPALGALIAGFTFASLHNIAKQGRILLGSVVIYGIATILFGFSRIFPLSLACLFFVGAGDTVSSIIRNTMRQLITPDHLRGRMVSVNMIFYLGGPQLGEVEAGIAAALLGTPLSVVFGGIGTIAATLIMAYAVPTLRKYDTHTEMI